GVASPVGGDEGRAAGGPGPGRAGHRTPAVGRKKTVTPIATDVVAEAEPAAVGDLIDLHATAPVSPQLPSTSPRTSPAQRRGAFSPTAGAGPPGPGRPPRRRSRPRAARSRPALGLDRRPPPGRQPHPAALGPTPARLDAPRPPPRPAGPAVVARRSQ